MTHWFTADLHLGHANIIPICKRPFADVLTMETALLRALHECVQPTDDLWVIGDFAIVRGDGDERERIKRLFRRIPGRKHLILGNHDKAWVRELGWASVGHSNEIIVDGRRVSLSHYPMITFPGARHGAVQLFGHIHDNWMGSRNSINVGVDVWNYQPVTLPRIIDRAAHLPVNPLWAKVEPNCVFASPPCSRCGSTSEPEAVQSGVDVIDDIVPAAGVRICPRCIEARTPDGPNGLDERRLILPETPNVEE